MAAPTLQPEEGPASSPTWEPLSREVEVTLLPDDPPRASRFALFRVADARSAGRAGAEAGPGEPGEIEAAIPLPVRTATAPGERAPRAQAPRIRRRKLPARLLGVADALGLLLDLPAESASPSAQAWSAALTAGLGVLARGRLQPAVSQGGSDTWVAGPLDAADLRLAGAIAAALPPLAHPVAIPGTSPIAVPSPRRLVQACWDALADAMVRTEAAGRLTGTKAFATGPVTDVGELRSWLSEACGPPGATAGVSLRVEHGREGELAARAVLQMTSAVDPSLVVDAGELFSMPASVLARFGEEAERDLLLALRRGARSWPPLGALLEQRVPSALDLDEGETVDLLLDGTEALRQAGIEVLWPAELLADRPRLRAVGTPAPQSLAGSRLDLGSVVQFHWEVALGDETLSGEELAALAEAKRGVVRLRGRYVLVDPLLVARAADRRARRASAAETLGALLAGEIELEGEVVEVAAEGPLADLASDLRELSETGIAELDHPPGLEGELRPYQRRGTAWLRQMSRLGLGACLADDMGLGKTVQVIALHLLLAEEGGGPTLVVCPTSLLANWERELGRFAPSVPVRRFYGGGRHLDALEQGEVVLTTYGVLRRERARLAGARFSLVVADEAQHAKNPLSETARALRALPPCTRVALTGTPVENRLSELWSLLDWTNPGLLGPLDRFRRTLGVAVERNRDPEATERLAALVRPFLLRRRKSDPAIAPELPERTVSDLAVPLTTEQASLYEAEVREALAAIAESAGIARRGLVLRLLTVLKQICNHPAQYLHQAGPLEGRSGKLEAVDELVDVILAEGDSVLVFSQFVEMCALLEAHLSRRGVRSLLLHGGVTARRRAEMVSSFQAGEVPVFLLSLRAGGVGLNLTRANHVVHYDRWWNPAVEDQASDRAHRIGQRRSVQIHRLVCEGTVEDRISDLLEAKRDLAESVVSAGESFVGDLSDEELAELVRLGAPAGGSGRTSGGRSTNKAGRDRAASAR